MKILLFLSTCVFLFSAQVTGLREIKIGDKLPDTKELKMFSSPGDKLILYIKSDDIKSITFFKTFARTIKGKKGKKDLKLFLIDANQEPDKRVSAVYDSLKIKKELIRDNERKIYGSLGIIVIPSLLFVTGENSLHSLIAGYRANLAMFFKSYLGALQKGEPVGDVYKAADRHMQQRKLSKMLNQAFRLMVNGDCQLAGTIYKKAVEKDPENNEALLGMGYSLLLMDKIDESLAYFTDLKLKKESKRVLLGYYLCKAMKEPTEESIQKIAVLAQLEPRFFFIIFRTGVILDKASKCEESKAAYRHSYKVLLRNHRRNK